MTCKSNVFQKKKKKTPIRWSLKPSRCLLLFLLPAYCSEGLGQLPAPDPVCLSVSPSAAASSKAMSCHALLPLELRPSQGQGHCDHWVEQEPPVRD